jgi:hypothetical protein
MAEPFPPPSLSRAREQKIDELSRHFANDDLSLEDLERRIERVYKAASLGELETITADLTLSPPVAAGAGATPADRVARVAGDSRGLANPSFAIEVPQQRMLAIMSSTRRVGRWTVPRELRVFAMMADTRLDLTTAMLPIGGIVNIELTAVMASFRIIVTPDMHVINDMHSIMSDVRNSADEVPSGSMASARTPVIRVTGTALMSEVKIKVRRREEPYGDEA